MTDFSQTLAIFQDFSALDDCRAGKLLKPLAEREQQKIVIT